jgi:hypothetical protein
MSDETPVPGSQPPDTPASDARASGTPASDAPVSEAGPERDAGLAAALAVPPLDRATRRSLVSAALDEVDADAGGGDGFDETPGRRPRRLVAAVGIAAALVLGAVVGTVIVSQPEDQSPQTAARAPSTSATQSQAKAAAPQAASGSDAAEAAPATAPPAELGDLGALNGDQDLRAAINQRLEAGVGVTPASIPCAGGLPGNLPTIYGLVSVTAAGTATLDGSGVVVLVGPTPAGANVAVVLDPARGCAFRFLTRL